MFARFKTIFHIKGGGGGRGRCLQGNPIFWIFCHRKEDLSTFSAWNVQWSNEFYRFLSIVEKILRAIIPTGHTFEGQCTATLRSLDTAIGGSSKDVLYFTLCVFSALQSWWNPIIPLKVRLAVALKEEAKWQVFVRDGEHWILLLYRTLILHWVYICNSVIKSRNPIKGFVLLFFGGNWPKDDVQRYWFNFRQWVSGECWV